MWERFKSSLANMAKTVICVVVTPIMMFGCSHFSEGFQAKSTFEEANEFLNEGNYQAALNRFEQILERYPATGDRALFEMGITYSHPKNEEKDYQKSVEYFQKLIRDFPESGYRKDSETMVFYVNNTLMKDQIIAEQQTRIATLQQQVNGKGDEIVTLRKQIEGLEQKLFEYVLKAGSADKILVEKRDRKLTLFSKGEVLKTYKIALGGDPSGPKERQGDNKTPEGTYIIDSRNKDSQYHLSLHISYPSERDKKRAKVLGVSPGGDVMIHGIKNGLSYVGSFHSEFDWTKGCIAVTDEEIEEIDKLVPNGTIVEIRQ